MARRFKMFSYELIHSTNLTELKNLEGLSIENKDVIGFVSDVVIKEEEKKAILYAKLNFKNEIPKTIVDNKDLTKRKKVGENETYLEDFIFIFDLDEAEKQFLKNRPKGLSMGIVNVFFKDNSSIIDGFFNHLSKEYIKSIIPPNILETDSKEIKTKEDLEKNISELIIETKYTNKEKFSENHINIKRLISYLRVDNKISQDDLLDPSNILKELINKYEIKGENNINEIHVKLNNGLKRELKTDGTIIKIINFPIQQNVPNSGQEMLKEFIENIDRGIVKSSNTDRIYNAAELIKVKFNKQ